MLCHGLTAWSVFHPPLVGILPVKLTEFPPFLREKETVIIVIMRDSFFACATIAFLVTVEAYNCRGQEKGKGCKNLRLWEC
jgi:hypothetical protein